MTKDKILQPFIKHIKWSSDDVVKVNNALFAMQAYADQETASLQAELTRLKEENSMLLERVNNG